MAIGTNSGYLLICGDWTYVARSRNTLESRVASLYGFLSSSSTFERFWTLSLLLRRKNVMEIHTKCFEDTKLNESVRYGDINDVLQALRAGTKKRF